MRDRTLLLGSLIVVASATGFGMLGVLARLAYAAGLEPLSFVAWRALFGTVLVAAWAAWRISRGGRFVAPWRLPARDRRLLAVVVAAGLVLNVAVFAAYSLTTVALVLLGFYTYPAIVAVIEVARGHEPLDGPRVAALACALGGMALVVAGGLDPAAGVRIDPRGLALALGAALAQTAFVIASRTGFPTLPTEQAMGWVLGATAIVCAGLALLTGAGAALALPFGSGDALLLAVVAGVVAAGVPSILFLTGIRRIGGTRTGILMLSEPVLGVVLAAAILAERILPIQVAGGAAILAAALLVQRSAEARPATPPGGGRVLPGAERP